MTIQTTNKKRTIHQVNTVCINQPVLKKLIEKKRFKHIDQKIIDKTKQQSIAETLASTNGKEILEIAKNDFELLSDDQTHHLLTRTDLDKRTHADIKYTLWSWANILEYDKDKLKSISKNKNISYDYSEFFFHQTHNTHSYDNSMFCCAGDPIYLASDKMLDTALKMKTLDGNDLGFIFDNYITGEGKITNLNVTFDTYARRNEIFKHAEGVKETMDFIKSTICAYESGWFTLPQSHKEQNSIQRMIAKDLDDDNVKGFISPEAAQIGYQSIINSYQDHQNKNLLVDNIIHSPFVFTHKNVIKPCHESLIANLLSQALFDANYDDTKKYKIKLIKNLFKHYPQLLEKIDNDVLYAHTKFLLD